jgi:RNA polymerase sigma factor (sigma-70 family)
MSPLFDVANDRFTRGIIRRKAKQIARRPGYGAQDIESLEQTILAQVIKVMPSFDQKIAHRNVFITTVVERYVRSLLKRQAAKKRGPRSLRSLTDIVDVAQKRPTQLLDTLEESAGKAHLHIEHRSACEMSDLVSDVANVIATLPEPCRQIVELCKSHSMVQVAAQLGVSRATVRGWMQVAAARFEEAGLREYLTKKRFQQTPPARSGSE